MRRIVVGLFAVALAGCGSTKTVTVSTSSRQPAARPATVTSHPATTGGPLPTMIAGSYTGTRPTQISFSQDGTNVVTNLQWSSWTSTQAVGQGTSNLVSCVPNCAQGSTTSVPATITLSNPQDGHFTQLTENRSGQNISASFSDKATWPVGAM